MITFEMDLVPYGLRTVASESILEGKIWTSSDGHYHEYWFTAGEHHVDGAVPKTMSGHQNPLHILLGVLKDAEPQIQALGLNYVQTRFDVKG